MDINNLTIGQARELAKMFSSPIVAEFDNGMIGKYVIVRCRDAGVHTGVLNSHQERQCVLIQSRRLWYWKPANGKKWLSGVALVGLDSISKVSEEISRIHLTENSEIIQTTSIAEASIRGFPANG